LSIMQAIRSIFSSRRPAPPPPQVTPAPAEPPIKPADTSNRVKEFQAAVSQGAEVAGRLDKMLSKPEPTDPFADFAEELKGRRRKLTAAKRGKARQ